LINDLKIYFDVNLLINTLKQRPYGIDSIIINILSTKIIDVKFRWALLRRWSILNKIKFLYINIQTNIINVIGIIQATIDWWIYYKYLFK